MESRCMVYLLAMIGWLVRVGSVFGRLPSPRVYVSRLTRQRDMLKIERIFNTFREHVAGFNMSATSLFMAIDRKQRLRASGLDLWSWGNSVLLSRQLVWTVVSKHRTERGSAGSKTTNTPETVFDPALPCSVLCLVHRPSA